MRPEILKNHKIELNKKGWTLIKSVFSKQEISRFRNYSLDHSINGGRNNGDLLSHKELQKIIFDERINKIAKTLLNDNPIYFGDSSVAVHSVDKRISHGFHKDSPDKDDPKSPSFQGEYSVLRFGVYLQDHVAKSQGLIIRSGSHKHANTTSGKKVIVPSNEGDVVVWYLTTTHSGNAKRIKYLKNIVIADDGVSKFQQFLYYRIPSFLIMPDPIDRISIFFTLGKKDHHLKRYIEYLKGRDYAVNTWMNSFWDTKTKNISKEKNIYLMDMSTELKNSKINSQADNYKLKY
tara:strand:- start:634 stop:1506 length:873 start_codon:yes stop_codon:yes gene_type:complete